MKEDIFCHMFLYVVLFEKVCVASSIYSNSHIIYGMVYEIIIGIVYINHIDRVTQK
jgi:hypothetical protein